MTCALSLTGASVSSTPMIFAISEATALPPTTQAVGLASPFTIASASAAQPAYPQPPQLAPGSFS